MDNTPSPIKIAKPPVRHRIDGGCPVIRSGDPSDLVDENHLPGARSTDDVFRQLVRDYGASLNYFVLKRVGHPDEAADIAQRAFVEAACTFSTFRGEAELSTWIFGIALNLARNHVNRAPQRRHSFESAEMLETFESPDSEPSVNAARRQTLALAVEAMDALPPEMSEALRLVAIEELSYEVAAERLGVPLGTVRSRVSRARAGIRGYFERRRAVPEY